MKIKDPSGRIPKGQTKMKHLNNSRKREKKQGEKFDDN